MNNAKQKAIRAYLADETISATEEEYTACKWDALLFDAEGQELLVCTESEREERWEDALDNYIEECILPEVPDELQCYFDEEAWKRDARLDGAANCLNHYDGTEHEYRIDGEWIYIYRTN